MEIIKVSGTARRQQNEYVDTIKSKKRRRAFPLTTLSRIDLKCFLFISSHLASDYPGPERILRADRAD